MKHTLEQTSIISFGRTRKESLGVKALAGTGKTTTMKELAQFLPGGLAVAFNVSIKKDLEVALPATFKVMTMNGLGHRALMRFLGRAVEIDGKKLNPIVTDTLREAGIEDDRETWFATRQLVSAAKSFGLVPKGAPGFPVPVLKDEESSWYGLMDHFDIEGGWELIVLAREVLLRSIRQTFAGLCDFDDQIYIPVVYSAAFDQYNIVLVDEAQDLSTIQHKILRKVLSASGRLFAVGDEFQAIYGFRGADADSFPNLISKFKMETLPLTINWRCSQAVISHAQELVPDIKARPDAPTGKVSAIPKWDESLLSSSSAIICRNNAPLISVAYKLIRRNVPVSMEGNAIGFKSLVNQLARSENISQLASSVEEWMKRESAQALSSGKRTKAENIKDKGHSLIAIIEGSRAKTKTDLLRSIDMLFSKKNGVPIMTGHKSKGKEFEEVFFLDSQLIPSEASQEVPWMMQQELNLDYVIRTRAKQSLTYIDSKGFV